MIKYVEKGEGLHTYLASIGLSIYELDGVWVSAGDEKLVNKAIKDYVEVLPDPMPAINAKCSELLAELTDFYPKGEVMSWSKQEAEARSGGGPLTEALALARGVPLDELHRRIIEKADAFATRSGQIIGTRQALEDRVAAGDLTACWEVQE